MTNNRKSPFKLVALQNLCLNAGKIKGLDQTNTVFSSDRITMPLPDAHVYLSVLGCLCDPHMPRKATHSIFETGVQFRDVMLLRTVFPVIGERTVCDCDVLCMLSIFPNRPIQVQMDQLSTRLIPDKPQLIYSLLMTARDCFMSDICMHTVT